MNVSSVLSETIATLRSALWVLFPIAFAGTAALEIITLLIAPMPGSDVGMPQDADAVVASMFTSQALFAQLPVLFIGTYINLLIIRVSWAFLTNEPLNVGDWTRQMLTLLIPGVMATFCALVLVLLGVVLFIIPALIIAALLMVILPVIVVEGVTGPVSALLRSRELMQEHLFMLIGLVLLLILAAFGFLTVVTPMLILAESVSMGILVAAGIGSILSIFSAVLPTVIYKQAVRGV